MSKLLAVDIPLFPQGQQFGSGVSGPLSNPGANPGSVFTQTLSKIIGVLTVVAFIWFTFQFIFGAIRIVTSGGDKAALEAARKQITTGIIGLVVVVAAIFIVGLIGTILGIPDILNPTSILKAPPQ